MNLEIGKIYNGFELISEEEVNEINSTARIFYHKKSGARVLNLENNDDNKVFSISFRTPPKDSTGVAHILEHSVLCGSRKFPVKEPFVELAKGSLNTFLNAMTFADKTMYPVASKNEKDFTNLMDVYLDAVFYPNIYKEPQIMMQEGWHYELDNKESELTYKGVVYNEMKGAFSSPEAILFRKISQTLFKDTTYRVESGGDPKDIPNLTQEQFTNFHKKYYHPSNSYIFLYGDMDICEKLKFIDENYLSNFDKIEVDSKIEKQKPFDKMVEVETEYPISQSEKEEGKTFLSLNYVVGDCKDTELYSAFDILEYILLEASGAPLKRALIDAKLGKDVFGVYDNSILQPTFSIVVKNSDESEKDRFKQVVKDTLVNLINKGIDKKSIEGAINRYEFQLRENDYNRYPKGLVFNIKSMDTWLYDEDPLIHLKYEKILEKIKTALNTNYFEKLIEKYLINNNHSSLLVVKPKKGMEEERTSILRKELSDYKNSLNENEINKIIEDTKKLKERQMSGDSKEDLNKIPLLSLKDIETKVEDLKIQEKQYKDIKVLHHATFTNKISYVNLIFKTNNVPEELIPYLGLLSRTLGEVNTKNYKYEQLSQEINIHTGGIEYNASSYFYNNNSEEFYPYFMVKTKALTQKLNKLFSLTNETLSSTVFDDKKRIKEIIEEVKSRLEMTIFDRGHLVACNRALSYISKGSKYMEILSGLSFYKFITKIEQDFDNLADEVINNLKKVTELIFNKKNLLVSVTCSEQEYENFEKNVAEFYDGLNNNEFREVKYDLNAENYNEGIMTSAKVQYVAKASNFVKLGYKYNGAMRVLKNIASLDYLWNKIRVQGGAYGAFAGFQRSGNMFFASYRDPNLKQTINAYDELYKYVENFNVDDREMTKYIIGTISELDAPLTAQMEGESATANYLRRVTYDDFQRERDEVINTKVEDIRKLAPLMKKATQENHICVVGNEEKIKENKEVFNTTINLFE